MTAQEKADAAVGYQQQFAEIVQLVQQKKYGMLILDEIMSCISCGFLPLETVLQFLQTKPPELEVVLTGRNPDAQLLELADYVSEICSRKHPYERGISARKGIEF